jgi:pyridoxine kinase
MKNILSIQSHVVYGYVGNRAAVFPLQRLGFNVSALNTVQFSNHTGYGAWEGDVFTQAHIADLYKGLKALEVSDGYDALLTGYMGSPDIGKEIDAIMHELREVNPNLIYCCDPVIGDVGRGVFVRPGVGEYFRDHLIQHANILTPNEFELSFLTGVEIKTLEDAQQACRILIDKGVDKVLVTSVSAEDIDDSHIGMMLYTQEGVYLATTTRFHFDIAPNGAGDVTAALFLGHMLKQNDPKQALSKTMQALHELFRVTNAHHSRELKLIESQDYFDTQSQPSLQLEVLS